MAIGYGDYAPMSRTPVQTLFVGKDRTQLMQTLGNITLAGGTPVRNILHEGMAAVLDNMAALETKGIMTSTHLHIIPAALAYEDFHSQVKVRLSGRFGGKTTDEIIDELRSARFFINVACPAENLVKALDTALGKHYGLVTNSKEADHMPAGWTLKSWSPTTQPKSNSPTASSTLDIDDGVLEMPTATGSTVAPSAGAATAENAALEAAVKQFLSAVLKLPQNQRADAIKRHLESPAYSAEYKQTLIATVKQLQGNNGKTPSSQSQMPPMGMPLTMASGMKSPVLSASIAASSTKSHPPIKSLPLAAKATLPAPPPSLSSSTSSPIWVGRVAFKLNTEMHFDVAAYPVANPKSNSPNHIPLSADFGLSNWPLVLEISSYVPISSAAIHKCLPLAKLVDLVPLAADSLSKSSQIPSINSNATNGKNNNECAIGFRQLLTTRQVVGLVRLGQQHVMLIASRPNQLVGMVLSRSQAALPPHQPSASAAVPSQPSQIPQPPHYPSALVTPMSADAPYGLRSASARSSGLPKAPSVPASTLTPDEILRQRPRPMSASPDQSLSTPVPVNPSNMDVFNALLGSQMMDFDLNSPHSAHYPPGEHAPDTLDL